jgi:Zn-dependent protease
MSLAGPAANFTLVLLAGLLIHIGLFAGVFQLPQQLNSLHLVDPAAPGMMEIAARFLSILFSLNLLLGTFNLLPIPPLDGFSAVGLVLPSRVAAHWDRLGHAIRGYSFIALLLCWQLFEKIYWPIFGVGVRLLYPHAFYR